MNNEDNYDKTKPIFQDDQPDGDDLWSVGFSIGGMACTDEFGLARSYKQAGDALVKCAVADADYSYQWAYPILFVYRHVIELYLKLIVRPDKLNHSLPALVERFSARVRDELRMTMPKWATARLLEFAEIDPDAQGFRFAMDKQGSLNPKSGEWWVEFDHLRKTMDLLVDGFERAHWALGSPRSR